MRLLSPTSPVPGVTPVTGHSSGGGCGRPVGIIKVHGLELAAGDVIEWSAARTDTRFEIVTIGAPFFSPAERGTVRRALIRRAGAARLEPHTFSQFDILLYPVVAGPKLAASPVFLRRMPSGAIHWSPNP